MVPRSRIFLPWRWWWYVPPKRRFISQDLHGATSQKTAFFIVTDVQTSNLTKYLLFICETLVIHMSKIINISTTRNYYVIFGNFSDSGICINGCCAWEGITDGERLKEVNVTLGQF
jgi:hypothetical protein